MSQSKFCDTGCGRRSCFHGFDRHLCYACYSTWVGQFSLVAPGPDKPIIPKQLLLPY